MSAHAARLQLRERRLDVVHQHADVVQARALLEERRDHRARARSARAAPGATRPPAGTPCLHLLGRHVVLGLDLEAERLEGRARASPERWHRDAEVVDPQDSASQRAAILAATSSAAVNGSSSRARQAVDEPLGLAGAAGPRAHRSISRCRSASSNCRASCARRFAASAPLVSARARKRSTAPRAARRCPRRAWRPSRTISGGWPVVAGTARASTGSRPPRDRRPRGRPCSPTNTSAISMMPALSACTSSPRPGHQHHQAHVGGADDLDLVLADADRLDQDHVLARGGEHVSTCPVGGREAAQVAARRHRADEHAGIGRVRLHADAVAEDRAAGERRASGRPPRCRRSCPRARRCAVSRSTSVDLPAPGGPGDADDQRARRRAGTARAAAARASRLRRPRRG